MVRSQYDRNLHTGASGESRAGQDRRVVIGLITGLKNENIQVALLAGLNCNVLIVLYSKVALDESSRGFVFA
jgi:hypothetical protein